MKAPRCAAGVLPTAFGPVPADRVTHFTRFGRRTVGFALAPARGAVVTIPERAVETGTRVDRHMPIHTGARAQQSEAAPGLTPDRVGATATDAQRC